MNAVLNFVGTPPEWSSEHAVIVSCWKGMAPSNFPVFRNPRETLTHPQIGYRARNTEDTQSWFEDPNGRTILFGDNYFGPDSFMLSRIGSNKYVWIAVQAKTVSGRGKDGEKLDENVILNAIHTVTPRFFCSVSIFI